LLVALKTLLNQECQEPWSQFKIGVMPHVGKKASLKLGFLLMYFAIFKKVWATKIVVWNCLDKNDWKMRRFVWLLITNSESFDMFPLLTKPDHLNLDQTTTRPWLLTQSLEDKLVWADKVDCKVCKLCWRTLCYCLVLAGPCQCSLPGPSG
jgi:hypothetical protein